MGHADVLNRSGQAYEELRRGIQSGRWAPEERLSTYRLAGELGMSRTPVIEALKRLEADGLIEITPQVGCRILPGRREDVEETFLIRVELEGLAAEFAAVRIDDNGIADLRALVEEAESAARAHDAEAFAAANRALHRLIVEASGLAHLERLLDGVWTMHRFQLGADGFLANAMHGSEPEHRAILRALADGDSAAARAAVEGHLRRCLGEYRAHMDALEAA